MSEPKVVLITGASSGFGLLAAVRLARAGCRVFAGYRDAERLGRLDDAARDAGVVLERVALDVTDARQVEQAVAEVMRKAGRVDVLVNNAGFGMGGFFEDVTDAELRAQFETNFFGLARVTRAVVPAMRQRRSGRIVNISSIAGRVAHPGMSAYCASKFAVEGLSEALRLELLVFGVDVVLIEPGTYKTDIFGRNIGLAQKVEDPTSALYGPSQRFKKYVLGMVDKVGGDPNEIAELITRIAVMRGRPRARYLKGPNAARTLALRQLLPARLIEAAARKALERLFADAR